MSSKSSSVELLLYGCIAIVSLITIMVLPQGQSGDSINPRPENTSPPSNSKSIGARVDINDTRNYTSMPIKYQGVEKFFV